MHELLKHVLNERDLTRAGDIFAIPDADIVDDLNEVIKLITDISSRPDYCRNDRDQALIEICVARVKSCVKETGTLEKYCGALVSLLESCLHHNLMPLGHFRDDDPPHAKIASDIIACIVLVSFPVQSERENYGSKSVMELFLPVAVQFLHKGNREISRHMARYLSLAAVHHAGLLKPHVQTIMDSIMTGNYPLCRILTNLYEVCPEPLEGHVTALVSLLPHAEQVEKSSLFALFELIAVRRADALKTAVPQLLSYLCSNTASQSDPGCMCIDILQLLVVVSRRRVSLLLEHADALRRAARAPHAAHERAQEAINFILAHLPSSETHHGSLRDTNTSCNYPPQFNDKLHNAVRPNPGARPKSAISSEVNRTSSGVTIVKLGPPTSAPNTAPVVPNSAPVVPNPAPVAPAGYSRRAKLGDSRSTGRLHPGPNSHRSMTRLNVAGGSVGGLHKSMTRLSSSQQINSQQLTSASSKPNVPSSVKPAVTVTGPLKPQHHHNIVIGPATNTTTTSLSGTTQPHSISVNPITGKSTDTISPSSISIQQSNTALVHVSVVSPSAPISSSSPVTVTSRRANNTSVTMINTNSNRISVFEPYPMRDTVQHFCEKHLDKIKAYMDMVSLRLPPPAKCTIEERRSKKQARLQFACGRRGPHCLFGRALFSLRTRRPHVWIHLMFLALQARHAAALSSRDPTVASLKHCWDILKCDNKTFLTLVTGAFPGIKEQEMLASELRACGFFDVFSVSTSAAPHAAPHAAPLAAQPAWGCFLCTHPDRAPAFLQADAAPVIEGQLKEKKGRWRLFRRWRTRYFTLSGAHLSCKGSSGGESIDINQIRSVKVSRGARNIPKAFEIFTGDQTLILKPKDGKNAEEWVQCLNIAVAHSQARDVPVKANSLPARGLTLKSF